MIKDLKKGQAVSLRKIGKEGHKTAPPARFTEVSLLAELDKRGLGRPSTFATIVSIIQDRGYVKKVKGQLTPTFLGFAVVRLLSTKLPEFTRYEYTSEMEGELDKIAENLNTRENFLDSFWNGEKGFSAKMQKLSKDINWEEIREISTTDLGNGYQVAYNKFGAFLQEKGAKAGKDGYIPGARIDDDATVDDVLDPEVCKKLLENSSNVIEAREIGVLSAGPYAGWTVTLRDGRFGPYAQALNPKKSAKEKSVNKSLWEGVEIPKVTMEQVEELFSEVKLPRTLSANYFVGVGKKGNWIGYKASAKSKRATFISMPEGFDPRTITLEQATKIWEDSKKDAPKTPRKAAAPKGKNPRARR